MTYWRVRGASGFEPQQRRWVIASNNLINCLVPVQPNFEINEVLNSILIVRVRCGVWGVGGVCH